MFDYMRCEVFRQRVEGVVTMTNREYINSLSNEELAVLTISLSEEPDYDYDYDDELYQCGTYQLYTTSDGTEFTDIEEAIEHEVWWLNQPRA